MSESSLVEEPRVPSSIRPPREGWTFGAVVFSVLSAAYFVGALIAVVGAGPFRAGATLGLERSSDAVWYSSRRLLEAAQAHRGESAVVGALWGLGWAWFALGAFRRSGVLATPEPREIPKRSIRWAALRLALAIACLIATVVAVLLQMYWAGRI